MLCSWDLPTSFSVVSQLPVLTSPCLPDIQYFLFWFVAPETPAVLMTQNRRTWWLLPLTWQNSSASVMTPSVLRARINCEYHSSCEEECLLFGPFCFHTFCFCVDQICCNVILVKGSQGMSLTSYMWSSTTKWVVMCQAYLCSSKEFAAGVWKCRFWYFDCYCLRNNLSVVCNMEIAHFSMFRGQKHDSFNPTLLF